MPTRMHSPTPANTPRWMSQLDCLARLWTDRDRRRISTLRRQTKSLRHAALWRQITSAHQALQSNHLPQPDGCHVAH